MHSNIGDILIYQCIYLKIVYTAERKTRVISAARIKFIIFVGEKKIAHVTIRNSLNSA